MVDPQYPFPSNVHVLSYVTLKLTEINYLLWKTQFESLLSNQKLVGFVNGAVIAPEPTRQVETNGVLETKANPAYES